MRRTRLVILPGARCLTQMCCLLLYLSCPNIGALSREQIDLTREDLYSQNIREIYGNKNPLGEHEEICCITESHISCKRENFDNNIRKDEISCTESYQNELVEEKALNNTCYITSKISSDKAEENMMTYTKGNVINDDISDSTYPVQENTRYRMSVRMVDLHDTRNRRKGNENLQRISRERDFRSVNDNIQNRIQSSRKANLARREIVNKRSSFTPNRMNREIRDVLETRTDRRFDSRNNRFTTQSQGHLQNIDLILNNEDRYNRVSTRHKRDLHRVSENSEMRRQDNQRFTKGSMGLNEISVRRDPQTVDKVNRRDVTRNNQNNRFTIRESLNERNNYRTGSRLMSHTFNDRRILNHDSDVKTREHNAERTNRNDRTRIDSDNRLTRNPNFSRRDSHNVYRVVTDREYRDVREQTFRRENRREENLERRTYDQRRIRLSREMDLNRGSRNSDRREGYSLKLSRERKEHISERYEQQPNRDVRRVLEFRTKENKVNLANENNNRRENVHFRNIDTRNDVRVNSLQRESSTYSRSNRVENLNTAYINDRRKFDERYNSDSSVRYSSERINRLEIRNHRNRNVQPVSATKRFTQLNGFNYDNRLSTEYDYQTRTNRNVRDRTLGERLIRQESRRRVSDHDNNRNSLTEFRFREERDMRRQHREERLALSQDAMRQQLNQRNSREIPVEQSLRRSNPIQLPSQTIANIDRRSNRFSRILNKERSHDRVSTSQETFIQRRITDGRRSLSQNIRNMEDRRFNIENSRQRLIPSQHRSREDTRQLQNVNSDRRDNSRELDLGLDILNNRNRIQSHRNIELIRSQRILAPEYRVQEKHRTSERIASERNYRKLDEQLTRSLISENGLRQNNPKYRVRQSVIYIDNPNNNIYTKERMTERITTDRSHRNYNRDTSRLNKATNTRIASSNRYVENKENVRDDNTRSIKLPQRFVEQNREINRHRRELSARRIELNRELIARKTLERVTTYESNKNVDQIKLKMNNYNSSIGSIAILSDTPLHSTEDQDDKHFFDFSKQHELSIAEQSEHTTDDTWDTVSAIIKNTLSSRWAMKEETKVAVVGSVAFIMLTSSVKLV